MMLAFCDIASRLDSLGWVGALVGGVGAGGVVRCRYDSRKKLLQSTTSNRRQAFAIRDKKEAPRRNSVFQTGYSLFNMRPDLVNWYSSFSLTCSVKPIVVSSAVSVRNSNGPNEFLRLSD